MNYSIVTEIELIFQIKKGSKSAFDELVNRYKEKAFGLAFHIVGNTEEAKDISQEAFIRVYKNIRSFKVNSSFFTWFYRIVVNLSYDYFRKNKYNKYYLSESVKKSDEKEVFVEVKDKNKNNNPKTSALNKELNSMIDAAILKLPQKQRTAFILKHLQKVDTIEIESMLFLVEIDKAPPLFKQTSIP
ncbi:MAG: sigma-70 family RNA polymerase sigma factor [Candidatus Omnitrophota bacterium]